MNPFWLTTPAIAVFLVMVLTPPSWWIKIPAAPPPERRAGAPVERQDVGAPGAPQPRKHHGGNRWT